MLYRTLLHDLSQNENLVSPSSYFLLVITLLHISINPCFASLSGKNLMASTALSTKFCARARVCSRPSLARTSSRACVKMLVLYLRGVHRVKSSPFVRLLPWRTSSRLARPNHYSFPMQRAKVPSPDQAPNQHLLVFQALLR
jgi:hypothetical protein